MSQFVDIINQINQLTGYNVPTSSNIVISQSATPVGSGSVNQIINYVNGLTGFSIPSTNVQYVSGSNVAGPVVVYIQPSPGGTIPTSGIQPGSIIRADHILRIIYALSGVSVDDIIISGSLSTSGSNTFDGNLSLPFIPDNQFLFTSGGYVVGVATPPSASFANTASYALTASYAGDYTPLITFNTFTSTYNTGSFSGSFIGLLEGTASWAVSASEALTASYAPAYLLIAQTGSMLQPYLLISQTGSMLQPYVLTSQTASMSVLSSSYASTASYTPSAIVTASVSLNTITFDKGDTNSFTITVDTGSAILITDYVTTASFNAFTSSVVTTSSFNAFTSSVVTTSSFNSFTASHTTGSFTGSFTGVLQGTASFASNAASASYVLNTVSASYAATASNILGGKAPHVPYFITDTTLATSSIYQSGSTSVIINQDNNTTANPEALYVWQPSTSSFNVISGKGNLNNYLQLNIQNTNQGGAASSDVVATADNGNETSNYIDMGINSENYSGVLGGPNDAYLYSTGIHLHIGNATPNQYVGFFAGGDDVDANMKMILAANNSHELTGSLSISGNLSVKGITTANQANVVTIDTSTGQLYYTASSAFGGGGSGVAQILTGSGISISPTSGIGVVTISATGGAGGDFVTTSSFNSYTGSSGSTFAGTAATASHATNFTIATTLTLDETLTDFAKVNSTIVGSNNLFQQATGSHTSAHGKYTVYKGANARAGEFVTVWNGTTTTYYDNATTDIGSTSDITFQSLIVTSQLQLNAVAATSGWTIKMLITYI